MSPPSRSDDAGRAVRPPDGILVIEAASVVAGPFGAARLAASDDRTRRDLTRLAAEPVAELSKAGEN